jgi:hypothetical protein
MPLIIITIPAMIYGVFLIILGLPALCVKIQFLIRVGKINKELKITMKEFNELAKKYYATRESAKSLEEFIKNNVL